MTETGRAPGKNEFELTLLGPGYGESVVLHVGGGSWVIVDSCVDTDGTPQALRYLESIDVDLAETVELIVATHWHDDHIRGIAKLVEVCDRAAFCCAIVLLSKEFLAVVGALEGRPPSRLGSGLKEIHSVFSRLAQVASKPTLAIANRTVFVQGECEIRALSPDDASFIHFLRTIGQPLPGSGKARIRIPTLSPNDVAVALRVKVEDVAVLLGSDLEKRGWTAVLENVPPIEGKASVFRVPHHGSENAHEQGVWKQMLELNPYAVLTPWRRGNRTLPIHRDVNRILSLTPNAYATAKIGSSTRAPVKRARMVGRTIRESGIQLRRLVMSPGFVRLRCPLASGARWKIETFGTACHLAAFARQ